VAVTATVENPKVPAPLQHHQQQETGQSVRAHNVNSLRLDNMFRVVTAALHIMTYFNGAVRRGKNSGRYKNYLKSNEAK
jgi:hypothetical protein